MFIPIFKIVMNILSILTSEITELQIDIEPHIKVEMSNTYSFLDQDTDEVFHIIDNDSTGTIILGCNIKYTNCLRENYELSKIGYYITKFIKKETKDEEYLEEIHKPSLIPFPKKEKPEKFAKIYGNTDEESNELSNTDHQTEFLPTTLNISIGMSGSISDIIRRLKKHMKVQEGDSFTNVAFSYTFFEQKHEDNPITNTTCATVTSKMFAFFIPEEHGGSYCMSLIYVNPEDYHIPILKKVQLLENPQLTE